MIEIEGIIASCGFASGDRVVIGSWRRSPIGAFTDVMWAEPGGRRRLFAPSAEVADFVASIYDIDLPAVPQQLTRGPAAFVSSTGGTP